MKASPIPEEKNPLGPCCLISRSEFLNLWEISWSSGPLPDGKIINKNNHQSSRAKNVGSGFKFTED
jgi:hypothetical protein